MFMLEKIKTDITNDVNEAAADLSKQAGTVLMIAAMATGMAEYAGHNRAVIPNTARVDAPGEYQLDQDPTLSQREETGPHYTNYGAMHRTPGRTGDI